MQQKTIDQTFDIAIGAERAAQELFRGLQTKFIRHEVLATLWSEYAEDEVHHAEWLARLKSRLTPEQLAAQVDENTVALLKAVTGLSVEKALNGVKNLEDAYQLVNEIENGETNAIFQFLLNCFEVDLQVRDFLLSQLNRHIARLSTGLPAEYKSAMARRRVKAA